MRFQCFVFLSFVFLCQVASIDRCYIRLCCVARRLCAYICENKKSNRKKVAVTSESRHETKATILYKGRPGYERPPHQICGRFLTEQVRDTGKVRAIVDINLVILLALHLTSTHVPFL